jgi:hypothetical protein
MRACTTVRLASVAEDMTSPALLGRLRMSTSRLRSRETCTPSHRPANARARATRVRICPTGLEARLSALQAGRQSPMAMTAASGVFDAPAVRSLRDRP